MKDKTKPPGKRPETPPMPHPKHPNGKGHESEDKVCTLEQSKRLVELGVVLETEKYWENSRYTGRIYQVIPENERSEVNFPAPDAAELGKLLPYIIHKKGYNFMPWIRKTGKGGWMVRIEDSYNEVIFQNQENTLAGSLCAALIWLIENNKNNYLYFYQGVNDII